MDQSVPFTERFSVYRAITEKIVAAIEAGAGEFVMPWHRRGPGMGRPANALTKASYRGVNVVALWAESMLSGYSSGYWASFRQWQKLGARVRKGEHGTTIVFYKEFQPGFEEGGEAVDERRLVGQASRVFNADQVEGWTPPLRTSVNRQDRVTSVDMLVEATQAKIRHGSEIACYRVREDRIEMPEWDCFHGSPHAGAAERYYSVLLHELTHWTGAAHRLDRTFGTRFGDATYAVEELVAELGAAFLCADLNLANEPRLDHAAYIRTWLQVLDDDPKAIFAAAREATKAVDYLFKLAA